MIFDKKKKNCKRTVVSVYLYNALFGFWVSRTSKLIWTLLPRLVLSHSSLWALILPAMGYLAEHWQEDQDLWHINLAQDKCLEHFTFCIKQGMMYSLNTIGHNAQNLNQINGDKSAVLPSCLLHVDDLLAPHACGESTLNALIYRFMQVIFKTGEQLPVHWLRMHNQNMLIKVQLHVRLHIMIGENLIVL